MGTYHCPANFILTDQGEAGRGPRFPLSGIAQGLLPCLLQWQWLPAVLGLGPCLSGAKPEGSAAFLSLQSSQPASLSTFNSPRDYSRITWVTVSLG